MKCCYFLFLFFSTSFFMCCNNEKKQNSSFNDFQGEVLSSKKTDRQIKSLRESKEKNKFELSKSKELKINKDSLICEECSIEYLVQIEKRLGHLDKVEILRFFKINTKECSNNIEFSEFANEIMFEIFTYDYKETLSAIEEIDSEQFKLICETLNNPINDKYSTLDIVNKLNQGKNNSLIKSLIGCLKK